MLLPFIEEKSLQNISRDTSSKTVSCWKNIPAPRLGPIEQQFRKKDE